MAHTVVLEHLTLNPRPDQYTRTRTRTRILTLTLTLTDGRCIESKTASFLGSVMLRGAPAHPSASYSTRSQCGNAYDARPHIYDGIMPMQSKH